MYTEDYKTLPKKNKEDTNKWRDSLCSWVGRLNIVRMSILLKLIYRVNAIPIKSLSMFSAKIEKSTLTFIWNLKEPRIAKTILKKNRVGHLTHPGFKK